RPDGPIPKADELRLPPLWPAVRKVSLGFGSQPRGVLPFAFRNPELASNQMSHAAGVIRMKMSENYLLHISWRNSSASKLRTDLLIGAHRKVNGSLVKGM